MRHKKHRQSLGVTREHREAMLSNLAVALITHGRIQTTLTKARALRPFVEKVVTKAKKASAATEKKDKNHLRRLALRDVRDATAIDLLFDEKVTDFTQRPGGYTRIYKLGAQRLGDAAEMALIEFVKADDPGYKKSKRKGAAKKGKKSAKKEGTEDTTDTEAEVPAKKGKKAAVKKEPAAEPAGEATPTPAEGEKQA